MSKGTFTENESRVSPLFDRALELRDRGDHEEAIKLLETVVDRLTVEDKKLLPHAHAQLGHIHDILGNELLEEAHFRAAATLAPGWELASLALFHALMSLGRQEEAMNEMLRLVSRCDSDGYRELLEEGFSHRLSPAEHDVVGKVRAMLARYRNGRHV
jgi:tetratricopeptide (TPR) repeat protein